MLKLLVNNHVSTDPVMPFRWCVSRDTIVQLERENAKNPFILFVVYHHGSKREERILAPLKSGIEYIPFSKSGKYTVFATIVRKPNHDEVYKTYLAQTNGQFRTTALSDRGTFILHMDSGLEMASQDIEIMPGHFAKKPAAWEQKWVNKWFKTPPRDECEYRKRRVFAYTVQPILLPLTWMTMAVLLFLMGIIIGITSVVTLLRGIIPSFKSLGQTGWDLDNIWRNGRPMIKGVWGRVLKPINIIAFIGVIVVMVNMTGDLTFTNIAWGVTFGTILIVQAIMISVWMIRERSWERERRKYKLELARQEELKKEEEVRLKLLALGKRESAFELLLCDHAPARGTDIRKVPKEQRTLRLWFQETKAKICKPYER